MPPQNIIPQPVEVTNIEPNLSAQLVSPPENLQTPNTFQNSGVNSIENNIIPQVPQVNPSSLNPTGLTMKDGNINTITSQSQNQNISLNNNMNDQYNVIPPNNGIDNTQTKTGIYQPKTPNDFMLGSKYVLQIPFMNSIFIIQMVILLMIYYIGLSKNGMI